MGEYYRGDEELECPKCGKQMSLSTDKGCIIWICPEHGKEWKLEIIKEE